MQKVILIPMLATGVLLGCQEPSKNQNITGQVQQEVQALWVGNYQGTTPCMGCLSRCDDCPGMLVNLSLKEDQTYVLQRLSLSGHNEIETLTGQFKWQDEHKLQLLQLEQRHLLVFDHQQKILEIREDQTGQPYQMQSDFILQPST